MQVMEDDTIRLPVKDEIRNGSRGGSRDAVEVER